MKQLMISARGALGAAAMLLAGTNGAAALETAREAAFYTFGDSLSDTGNLLAIAPDAVDNLLYYRGVFSNGPLWTDIISRHQALYPGLINPALSASTNGMNLAHAGSRSGRLISGGPTDVSFLAQVAAFEELLDSGAVRLKKSDVFTVWTGANDYFAESIISDPELVVSNIEAGLWDLIDAGAETIIVPNLPDLGLTPMAISSGEETQAAFSETTAAHNARLAEMIDRIRSASDVTIIDIDVAEIFDEIIANPGRFGFSVVDQSCLDAGLAMASCPDDYLFYDGVHPSYAAHSLLAVTVVEALQNSRR